MIRPLTHKFAAMGNSTTLVTGALLSGEGPQKQQKPQPFGWGF